MFEKLIELRQKRGAAIAAMRAVQEKAEKEKRSLSAEEEAQFDRADKEQEELRAEVEKLEKEEARAKKLAGLEAEGGTPRQAPVAPATPPAPGEGRKDDGLSPELRSAFDKIFRHGWGQARLSEGEARALQADNVVKGGFLVAPIQMVNEFIKAVDDQVFIRQHATKFTVTDADGLGAPSLDTDLEDGEWTPELKIGAETEIALGARELRPHQVSKAVTISRKLLRKTAGSAATLALQRLAYKFSVTEEKAFLLGDGDRKPLGVFVASDQGVPVARDVEAGAAAAGGPSADGLIDVKHALKAAYWPRARWLFPRAMIKHIRKLKDGNNQYLWQPGLVGGIPDRIVEQPYDVSEFAPAVAGAGKYVGLIADWSQYWIADALSLEVQRVEELYAATNRVGFIGRAEVDGMPVNAEAFARVKLT